MSFGFMEPEPSNSFTILQFYSDEKKMSNKSVLLQKEIFPLVHKESNEKNIFSKIFDVSNTFLLPQEKLKMKALHMFQIKYQSFSINGNQYKSTFRDATACILWYFLTFSKT